MPAEVAAAPGGEAGTRTTWRRSLLVSGTFLLLAAAGAAIRLSNLRGQILIGDELHAVRAALTQPLARALTTYRVSDACIPLTALYRFLLDRGGRLDEGLLRAPVLLCGLLFLVAVPPLLARRFGAATALVFAALAAISPLLVFYSRIVRSYMPAVALSFGAALAFLCWLENGRARWAVAYVGLGALAIWFHLLTGPIVVLPLLFAAGSRLRAESEHRAPAWRLAAVAAGLGCALLLLIGPAAASLRSVLAQKVGSTPMHDSERWRALGLLFPGTASPPLALTFWLFAGLGLAVFWQRRRSVALYAGVLVGGHVAVLLLAKPFAYDSPAVFARYMLPTLPWVLLAAAQGLVALGEAARGPDAGPRSRQVLATAAIAAFVGALAIGGPLGDPALRNSSFLHSATFLLFPCPRPEMPAALVPAIYRTIAASPGTGSVVESPGAALGTNAALRIYQETHRRAVEVTADRLLHDHRLRLRNTVDNAPESLLQGPADWVLVHRDLGAEEDRVSPQTCFGIRRGRKAADAGLDSGEIARGSAGALRVEARLTAAFGPPDSAADGITAWDLTRLRREGGAGERRATNGPRHRAASNDRRRGAHGA